MACDPFASSVIKSMLELSEFHLPTYKKLKGSIFKLCTNEQGCRVIQKVLELCNADSCELMVKELKQNDKTKQGGVGWKVEWCERRPFCRVFGAG